MKILIVGLGSIGKRHAACLQQLPGVELAVLRTARGTLKAQSSYREFYSMEEALAFAPDGVIIANPTSLHVAAALPFLEKGIKVLIEKPVAHTVTDAEKLAPYSNLFRVAYCLRFLPLTAALKKIIAAEKVFKLGFKRSYYLPKWHPYADYRTEYTAKKELGGGVIRTLSHEIDLMLYFFGKPVGVTGTVDKVSHLEIDTDDYAFVSCKTAGGARVNFELDFFSPVNVNTGELFTDKGKYNWDTQAMYFTPYDAAESVQVQGSEMFDFSRMYVEQVTDFIRFVKTGESVNSCYQDAVDVLNVISAAEQSA